ncbi:hypothetical protein BHM03_00061782 [Ensete ventricosum]|nr:hypothetical protein BHM03_00061782 [Ensete ventricosum]
MARHAALMAHAVIVGLACCPDGSTSDADVSTELAQTCLHLGCRRGCSPGVSLGELGPPTPPKGVFPRRSTGRKEDPEHSFVVLGDGRSMASFDPLVFRPPTSRQPNIDLCAIAFLEPLAVVAQLKTKRTGRVRAPSGTPGLLVRDGRRAFLRPRP